MDGQGSDFFSGLRTLEQRAKKCIELRVDYAEYIPISIIVASQFPGPAKDLSASNRIWRLASDYWKGFFP